MHGEFDRDQLALAARRFYLDDVSKVDLAAELGVSRFKVARMLQAAREQGIVTIDVHDRGDERQELAERLATHLGLPSAIVVSAGRSEDVNRERMAIEAARTVARTARPDDVIGFSWGRTIAALTEHLRDLPRCTIVQLTGTVGNDISQSPIEVLHRLAAKQALTTVAVFAPLFASSAATAEVLRAEPTIAGALEVYDQLTTVVIAIGSWHPRVTQITPYLSADDMTALESSGATAEVIGTFLDDSGGELDLPLNARRIAASLAQIRRTPRVIAVAGSAEKVNAIHAVVSAGVVTDLVTDETAALRLLDLPPVGGRSTDRAALGERT